MFSGFDSLLSNLEPITFSSMRIEAEVGKSEIDALETSGPVVTMEPRLTLATAPDEMKMESNEKVKCSCCKDGFADPELVSLIFLFLLKKI